MAEAAIDSPSRLDRCVELLQSLCQVPAPTGREHRLREQLQRSWSGQGVNVVADPTGNLLGRVGGIGKRVLVEAHMDEVGYLVRHVTADGFLFLDSAQGGRRGLPERRLMAGQSAEVLGRDGVVAEGVIVAPSGHVVPEAAGAITPANLSEVFLDVGAESRQEVEALGVRVGSAVIWKSPTRRLGNRVVSKTLDDRAGFAVIQLLLESLQRDSLTCELWVGATTQEENGLHGARAVAAAEKFDAVLAVDCGLAGDFPVIDSTEIESRLGAGPVVVHHDALVAYDHDLCWELVDLAGVAGIPVQQEIFGRFGTDGVAFIEAGSPAVVVGPPVRYTHTAVEMLDVRDLSHTAALVERFVTASTEPGGRHGAS